MAVIKLNFKCEKCDSFMNFDEKLEETVCQSCDFRPSNETNNTVLKDLQTVLKNNKEKPVGKTSNSPSKVFLILGIICGVFGLNLFIGGLISRFLSFANLIVFLILIIFGIGLTIISVVSIIKYKKSKKRTTETLTNAEQMTKQPIGKDDVIIVSAGMGVAPEPPKTMKEILRNQRRNFMKKLRSKNPNNLAARILCLVGVSALITGIILFALPLANVVDFDWWIGLVLVGVGMIVSGIGIFLYEAFFDLKHNIGDKILKMVAMILFVAVMIAIICILIVIAIGIMMLMSWAGWKPTPAGGRRSYGYGSVAQPESASSQGKGCMMLDGVHYYIQNTDGSRINIESYDRATGVGKGYDGNTYKIDGGGINYK